MDFPRSVPSVGLVDGKFVDEDPTAGTPGSLIPSAWGNAVTIEVLSVIQAAGLGPSEADLTQLLQAIRKIEQVGSGNSGTDTGAANIYTVAYTPVITALNDGAVLRFKAKTSNTGASTFSPNGMLAKPLVGLGLAALQGGEIVANGMCAVAYSATLDQWVLLSSAGGSLPVAAATKSSHAMQLGQAVGRLLRRSIYRNNAGTLQVSVDGGPFVNASSTYSALNPNGRCRALLQGGGGPGGMAASTATGHVSAGSGGAAGGWCEKMFLGGFDGLAITVGAGGVSPSTPGGSTSFGPSLSASGGGVGGVGSSGPASSNFVGGVAGGIGIGGDINGRGGAGTGAFYGSTILGGYGGASLFGMGAYIVGGAPSTGTVGNDAESPGSGGSGAANGSAVPANILGGRGAGGLLILEEYSR